MHWRAAQVLVQRRGEAVEPREGAGVRNGISQLRWWQPFEGEPHNVFGHVDVHALSKRTRGLPRGDRAQGRFALSADGGGGGSMLSGGGMPCGQGPIPAAPRVTATSSDGGGGTCGVFGGGASGDH